MRNQINGTETILNVEVVSVPAFTRAEGSLATRFFDAKNVLALGLFLVLIGTSVLSESYGMGQSDNIPARVLNMDIAQ